MAAAVTGNAPVALRSSVAAVFFLVSPGLAVLAPARFRWELELALLVPASLAVTTVVSVSLFFAGAWSPLSAGATLTACSLAGALGLVAGGRAAETVPTASPSGPTGHDVADLT